jgi:hypothetical protein
VATSSGVTRISSSSASVSNVLDRETKVYPNPVSEMLHISSNSPVHNVQLFDDLGAMVIEEKDVMANDYTLDLSNYHSGVYTLVMDGVTKRILVL